MGSLPLASLVRRTLSSGSSSDACAVSLEPELSCPWPEASLWSVCSGLLCSELLLGLPWWLSPGERKTSLSESSESVSGVSGSAGSSGSFCGSSSAVGGASSSLSDS